MACTTASNAEYFEGLKRYERDDKRLGRVEFLGINENVDGFARPQR